MKPYYERGGITIYHGDCREVLPTLPEHFADLVIADPPYGDTSLEWDTRVLNWLPDMRLALFPSGSLWCFGSLRMFLAEGRSFEEAGLRYAQDLVWEKHNGSSFHADRFKRVHEIVAQFYRAGARWAEVYKSPLYTHDATARTVRRKTRPPHTGHIEASYYTSEDGGPRLQRSVINVRSCHGYAEHPTQKPVELVAKLIKYSCPPGGVVLSPFMGSGTDLVAARLLGRGAIGIEIEERYCEIAARRLAQDVLPLGSEGG